MRRVKLLATDPVRFFVDTRHVSGNLVESFSMNDADF